MPFWSDAKWKAIDPSTSIEFGRSIVKPFKADRAKHADYTLTVGDEIYLSNPSPGNTIRKLERYDGFVIDPGQFCFFITGERVTLNTSQLGFISIRASKKFYGLVNVSGFHVDPGYDGKLIFAAFNAGPTRINLKQGDEIFSLWVADLDQPSLAPVKKGYDRIPADLVNKVSGEFLTAYQLNEKIKSAQADIVDLKAFKTQMAVWLALLTLIFGVLVKDQLIAAGTAAWSWLAKPAQVTSTGTPSSSPSTSSAP